MECPHFQGGLMRFRIAPFILCFVLACTSTHINSPSPRTPSSSPVVDGLTWSTPSENQKLWSKYCKGNAASSDVPEPNYNNDLVKNVVQVFRYVAPNSFYLYPTIVNAYGLKNVTPPRDVSVQAHTFLTYLCGEFRDRASMVEAKLIWITKFNKLRAGTQKPIPANHQNVWADFSANSYNPFLKYSKQLWYARQSVTPRVELAPGTFKENERSYKEQAAVEGMTVCTVKYMVNEIAQGKTFSTLENHNSGYEIYSQDCPLADKEDYYDFRGDSNFKPNSPESNGMIWYANYISSNCRNTKTARQQEDLSSVVNRDNIITDEVCSDYFKNPFRRRWQAARSGLATWLLRNSKYDRQFADDNSSPLVVLPHLINQDPLTVKPFSFKVEESNGVLTPPLADWIPSYTPSDFAMNDYNFNKNVIHQSESVGFERLRDAMNRHTNWYQSQWDDGLGSKYSFKTQAYSPFVASSYEPSESDQFTFCGVTVPCPPDGFKHWMFVFRVKGANWFKVEDIAARHPVNFSYQWFDETSLGTTSLADQEHAWDRLGTALEEELIGGAILYLHNIKDGSWTYSEVSDDGNNP